MNIKYQVGKDDELKCSKEEQENNKENEVLEEEKGKKERDGGHKPTYKDGGVCQDISSVWGGEVSREPVQG